MSQPPPDAQELRRRLEAALATLDGDRFAFETWLGSGGFGHVYRYTDSTTKQAVAIKACSHRLSGDLEERFKNERQVSEFLWANGVQVTPQVIRQTLATDPPHLVLQYIEGTNLESWLKAELGDLYFKHDYKGLEPRRAVPVLLAIATAIQSLHALEVQHRDIKPGNIMLLEDPAAPGGWRVRLLDLGVAKLASNPDTLFPLRRPQTPQYSTPERLAGIATTYLSEDVYALGVIAYEMLAGFAPWLDQVLPGAHESSPLEALREIGPLTVHGHFERSYGLRETTPPTPLATLDPTVPGRLSDLIQRMLAPAHLDRPTMLQVVDTLRAELGMPPLTRPSTPAVAITVTEIEHAEPLPVYTKPRRRRITLEISTILIVVATATFFLGRQSNKPIAEPEAIETPPTMVAGTVVPRGAVGSERERVRFAMENGAAGFTWEWVFGAGANPSTVNGREVEVTLTEPGTYEGTITGKRATDSTTVTMPFTFAVLDADEAHPDLIRDPALELAIRRAIDHQSGPVTELELRGLTTLQATRLGITTLAGLEHCTSLKALVLDDNPIIDLTPLAGLSTLETLELRKTALTADALAVVGQLTGLRKLTLTGHELATLPDLSRLDALTYLDLRDNGLDAVDGLPGLRRLETLYLQQNDLTTLPDLNRLPSLEYLDVSCNQLTELPRQMELPSLSKILLSGNLLVNVAPLQGIASLQSVWLCQNPTLETISGLDKLPDLETLFAEAVPDSRLGNEIAFLATRDVTISPCTEFRCDAGAARSMQ